jgi:rRNA maturation RNase YbeY
MHFPDLPNEEPATPVTFEFEDVAFDLHDTEAIAVWLQHIAAAEGKNLREITYVFCSDEYLRNINIEHLQHDYYTDIITFPFHEPGETDLEGDLFISSERVAENADAQGVSFFHELQRVMAHGVLHMAGYGDETDEEEKTMREKEDFYLKNRPIP